LKVSIKLDESLHDVTVVIPTNDREILGSTPGRYNLQIKITSGCVLFWEMDPVFFGWKRVNLLWYGREKFKPVCVVPVGICLFVVVKKKKSTAS